MLKKLLTLYIVSLLAVTTVSASPILSTVIITCDEDTKELQIEYENPEDTKGLSVDQEELTKTPVYTAKNILIEGEHGPFIYRFRNLQVSSIIVHDDTICQLYGMDKDKEYTLAVFDVQVENTVDEKNIFNIDFSKITTNTKEQVDSNAWMNDYIDSEYLGQVIHSGAIYYILESKAEEIESIKFYMAQPYDANYGSIPVDDTVIEFIFSEE